MDAPLAARFSRRMRARTGAARRFGRVALALIVASCADRSAEVAIGAPAPGASSARASLAVAARSAIPPGLGSLQVSIATPDGEPWTGACCVFATKIGNGGDLAQLSDALQHGPSVESALPPGRWRVHVDVEEPIHSCCIQAPGLARFGSRELECEVRRGETTHLAVGLRAGGRLRLELELPDGVRDAELEELLALPEPDRAARIVAIASATNANRCALVTVASGAGSTWEPLRFLVPGCARLAVDRIVPGIPSTSETFFDPGPLALHIEAAGCEPIAASAAIESGRDTELRMKLRRASVAH